MRMDECIHLDFVGIVLGEPGASVRRRTTADSEERKAETSNSKLHNRATVTQWPQGIGYPQKPRLSMPPEQER
jgi:hypothetical protein